MSYVEEKVLTFYKYILKYLSAQLLVAKQHQVLEWWSQARPRINSLGAQVLAKKEFRAKTNYKRKCS